MLRDSYLALGDYDGLIALYAQNGDWEGLVEVLSGAADKASDPELKIDLSFRCATVFVEQLHAPDRAFRSYERVLSVRPDDGRAAAADMQKAGRRGGKTGDNGHYDSGPRARASCSTDGLERK